MPWRDVGRTNGYIARQELTRITSDLGKPRAQKEPSLRLLENQLCPHLNLGHLARRAVEQQVSAVQSHTACAWGISGTLAWQGCPLSELLLRIHLRRERIRGVFPTCWSTIFTQGAFQNLVGVVVWKQAFGGCWPVGQGSP